MGYRVIEGYYRQEHLDLFRSYLSPFYSLTFDLPAAPLRSWAKEHGRPVYLSLCYAFTRAMMAVEDLRYRLLDGRVVLYDEVHPALTLPVAGGRFRFAYFRYHADPERFFREARQEMEHEPEERLLGEAEEPNHIFFTSLPGVPFTAFTHAVNEPTETQPKVAFGRFKGEGDDLQVPVGLQVNHMMVDGRALGQLYERASAVFRRPEREIHG